MKLVKLSLHCPQFPHDTFRVNCIYHSSHSMSRKEKGRSLKEPSRPLEVTPTSHFFLANLIDKLQCLYTTYSQDLWSCTIFSIIVLCK